MIIIYSLFSHQHYLMAFHWSLSDSKSLQVSRTLLSILAIHYYYYYHHQFSLLFSEVCQVQIFSYRLLNTDTTVSSFPQSTKIYIYQLHTGTWCNLEDLPRVMADRDGWQKTIKGIHAVSTLWWWWWILMYFLSSFNLSCFFIATHSS